MKEYRFTAVLENAGGGGVFIPFPYDAKEEFGKARVRQFNALLMENCTVAHYFNTPLPITLLLC